MSQTEEDAFLTQATKAAGEARADYYRRQADQGNAGEPSHSNEVVLEDWYSDDELLTQYVFRLRIGTSVLVQCFRFGICIVVEFSRCCIVFHLNYLCIVPM